MPPHRGFNEAIIVPSMCLSETYQLMEMEPESSSQYQHEDNPASVSMSSVVSDDEECSGLNSRIVSSLSFRIRSPKRSRCAVMIEDDDIQDDLTSQSRQSSLKMHKNNQNINGTSNKSSRVSFDCLRIREYNVVFGDHPCCSNGPPLALGWNHDGEDVTLNLDEYESSRAPRKARRDLRMTCELRRQILLLDQTERELQHEERKFCRERQRRARSCATEGFFINPQVSRRTIEIFPIPPEKDFSVL